MHDRDDEEKTIQNESLERLETVSYHLTELYKLLSKDRDSWAVTGGDLGQAIQELQKQIQKFAAVDEAFRKQLGKFIREETKQAAATVTESMKQSVKEATTQEVATVTKKLDAAVDRAVAMIAAYNKEMDKVNSWWIPGCLILGAVAGGMIGALTIDYIHERPVVQRTSPPAYIQEVPKARYYPKGNEAR